MNFQGKVKIERFWLHLFDIIYVLFEWVFCVLTLVHTNADMSHIIAFMENCFFLSQEKVSDPAVRSSHFPAQSNVFPYAPAMKMMDNDDSISHRGSFLS